MAVRHGTRSCYVGGCRCDKCVGADRDYQKTRYQAKNAEALGVVTALPAIEVERTVGPVETGVLAEIDGLSTTATRQGLVEVALALARVLDNPIAIAQHPSSAHRLSETLDKIRKGSDAKASKLASVRSMSRPARVAG